MINRLRRIFQTKRIGHSGTLDPLATGLLVVAVGPATRFLQYLPLEPKTYIADIKFGEATSTYDAEGEIVSKAALPPDFQESIDKALPNFRGLIDQLPPMFSAIKVNGQPLYKAARQGVEIERRTRRVHIRSFEVIEWQGDICKVKIVCSGGTYIRSLAHDLGAATGFGAHLASLQRPAVGKFHIEAASTIETAGVHALIPLAEALLPMPEVVLSSKRVDDIQFGRPVPNLTQLETNETVTLKSEAGMVIGMGRAQGDLLFPEVVIPREQWELI